METTDLEQLVTTVRRLRGKDGCPWDQRQTGRSMLSYLRAETEELVAAVSRGDAENTCEELGDVLYVLLMLTTIAGEESGEFTLSDVLGGINAKLIRRHPHVFGDATVESDDDLARQWEAIKAEEKAAKQRTARK